MRTRFAKSLILVGFILTLVAPQAQAAKLTLSDNNTLVKGCAGTIEIKVDSEGAGLMAGDSTLNISSNEVGVSQVNIGSAFPMQVYNQVTSSQIKLSGARMPMSGSFKGVGTYGYISFTPNLGASNGTFSFSQDLTADNTLVDENISNVLTEAVSKTYVFKERYNKEVDGTGFCTPDATGPAVQFVAPQANSSNNLAGTNVVFTLSDDRTGVDINSLSFSIDGVSYSGKSTQVTVNPDGNLYRVEANPDADFKEGASVSVKVRICDKNTPTNCTDANTAFRIYTPVPMPTICGDGFLNPNNGEQCDDGNRISGDGCSSFCLIEGAALTSLPTCFDGLMNGGESGIDCGGPCDKTCPNCVDGVINQGETGVDCGGPCPVCGEKAPSVCPVETVTTGLGETVTVCHYPKDDPEHPYTMVIPKAIWPDYEKAGDVLGGCSASEMCNILVPVAPEVEKKATEEAVAVAAKEQSVVEQKVVIEAPKTQANVLDQMTVCKAVPDYAKANFDSDSSDTDGDGLSDRTECYAKTSPINPDTDGDTCSDGDELNRFGTNPLDSTDCTLAPKEEGGFQQVLITDPKPSWTLGNLSPRFSGIIPQRTTAVTVTAFHADQKVVKGLSDALNAVLQANDSEKVVSAIASLKTAIETARAFVDLNGIDFNYADLQSLIGKIGTQLDLLSEAYASPSSFVPKDYFESLKELGFGDLGLEVGALLRGPIVMGSTNEFSDTYMSDQPASNFELTPAITLEDQKLYDVVATATRADKTISSVPIQFGVNTGFTVSKPVPRTLGGQLIPTGSITMNGILVPIAYAQEAGTPQLEIDQPRPVITGETEFGSQVFAIWNSVVLSSSVISDSEQGAFSIQAPRDLEPGTTHRVTLYAVKTDADKTLRSESVDIYFRIKSAEVGILPIAAATAGGLTLVALAYFILRRLQSSRSVIKFLRSSQR